MENCLKYDYMIFQCNATSVHAKVIELQLIQWSSVCTEKQR